jgi:LDH2 family malate/lactate/ureidoglycolate dehydrogenase
MEIRIDVLQELVKSVLAAHELPEEPVEIITRHLIESELRGRKSHGISRIPLILEEYANSSQQPVSIVKETPVSVLLDGGNQNGMVVADKAMALAIGKAVQSGIGLVGGFHCTGIGVAGYIAEQALEADLIGMVITHAPAAVAPFGSRARLLGTNPIAFAIPGTKDRIISDLATAKMTFGDIVLAAKLGQALPPGVMLDQDGRPTQDPNQIERGAILPIGGPKGSALSVAIQALTGAISATYMSNRDPDNSFGFMVGAINPEIFVPIEDFKRDVQNLVDAIRTSPPAEGFTQVLVPGEREDQTRRDNLARGSLKISGKVLDAVRALV